MKTLPGNLTSIINIMAYRKLIHTVVVMTIVTLALLVLSTLDSSDALNKNKDQYRFFARNDRIEQGWENSNVFGIGQYFSLPTQGNNLKFPYSSHLNQPISPQVLPSRIVANSFGLNFAVTPVPPNGCWAGSGSLNSGPLLMQLQSQNATSATYSGTISNWNFSLIVQGPCGGGVGVFITDTFTGGSASLPMTLIWNLTTNQYILRFGIPFHIRRVYVPPILPPYEGNDTFITGAVPFELNGSVTSNPDGTVVFSTATRTYGVTDVIGDVMFGGAAETLTTTTEFEGITCKIPDLTALTGTVLTDWENGSPVPLVPRPGGGIVDGAVQCLMTATNQTLQRTSWWRPIEYQRHFYEIADRWYKWGLSNCILPECQPLKTTVTQERTKHGNIKVVCNPDAPNTSCAHPDGRAFDAREVGVTPQMLNSCNLYKRYPESDGVHLELIPTPVISTISPSSVQIGNINYPFTIRIKGPERAGKFYRGSKVLWNGQERPTIFVKESLLHVVIPATDLQTVGTNVITVVNPFYSPLLPGSGISNPINFVVNQSFLNEGNTNKQPINLLDSPTVVDSRVSVKFRQELVNGNIRYSYRVINKSQRPISNLLIGYDNQNNFTLEYPPVGWDIFTGIPSTSFTSPTNWGFDVLWNEGTDFNVLRWNATQNTSMISPNTIKSGFSVIVPEIDSTYASWFSVTLDDGTVISANLVPDNTTNDFDGDGKSDISVFRPSTGAWYLLQSQAGFSGMLFGSTTDRMVPADFDGDGKTDIAVYRPSTGFWYVLNSSNGTVSYNLFGIAEDLPAPGDYDGDGKADVAVFRPSTGTWYRTNSSTGTFVVVQFGASGDKPTMGDFDGDGKADIALYRPSNGGWYRLNSSTGVFVGAFFGTSTDVITPADFDGDGKTDLAVYRPSGGTWYIIDSSTAAFRYFVFGVSADIPAAGDFDGDGKADVSVFRPTDGTWYRLNSSTGAFFAAQFGANGDRPTQSAFAN